MKKMLILMMLFCTFASQSVVYASEVVPSNTPTVDAVMRTGTQNETEDDVVGVEEEDVVEETSSETTTEPNDNVEVEEDIEEEDESDIVENTVSNNVTPVSMADVEKRISRKGSEALSVVQMVAYIVISIIFIIALILVAASKTTGGGDPMLRNAGFGGIIACAVCYVLVYAGPFILEFLKNWAVS